MFNLKSSLQQKLGVFETPEGRCSGADLQILDIHVISVHVSGVVWNNLHTEDCLR